MQILHGQQVLDMSYFHYYHYDHVVPIIKYKNTEQICCVKKQ